MAAPHHDSGPFWLSHHHDDQLDRCVSIAGRPVCRRCLVLYPTIVLVALLALVLDAPGSALWAAWLLPAPLAVEWIGEHLGRFRYSPWRQIALTAVAAIGFGIALAVHVDDPFAPAALAPVAAYVVLLAAVAVLTRGDTSVGAGTPGTGREHWETAHERDESERAAELHRKLEAADARMAAERAVADATDTR